MFVDKAGFMSEPVYEFIKGKGWIVNAIPQNSAIRIIEGKTYRVTILDIIPEPHARYAYPTDTPEKIKWWQAWNGVPAGFGPVGGAEQPSTRRAVLTELIE